MKLVKIGGNVINLEMLTHITRTYGLGVSRGILSFNLHFAGGGKLELHSPDDYAKLMTMLEMLGMDFISGSPVDETE